MRVFVFNKVIYDGYLSVDLFLFVIRQKFSRIFAFLHLFPDFIKFVLRKIDISEFAENFYKILLDNITVSELNLFKVSNINKIDLDGFGITKDNPNNLIVTAEPSFLIDLFINRNKYQVICTNYDIRTRKIVNRLCLHENKIKELRDVNIHSIDQLYIYSFQEKEMMNIANIILVYRDHELISYDSYEGTLKDSAIYDIAKRKLLIYLTIAIFWFVISFIIAVILSLSGSGIAAFIISYFIWVIASYVSTVIYVNEESFNMDHIIGYLLGVIPNFLLICFLVIIFTGILGLYPWFVFLVSGIIAFPLLFFLTRFYKFD